MTPEKIIKLNGQDVKMIYCTATENGFEDMSNRSIQVFFPTFGKDKEGNDIIVEPAQAKTGDFITLALAAIVAAAAKDDAEPPINAKYILYNATPQERTDLLTAIIELRAEWYKVNDVAADLIREEAAAADRAAGKGKRVQRNPKPKNA